jgi:hypothetical protein
MIWSTIKTHEPSPFKEERKKGCHELVFCEPHNVIGLAHGAPSSNKRETDPWPYYPSFSSLPTKKPDNPFHPFLLQRQKRNSKSGEPNCSKPKPKSQKINHFILKQVGIQVKFQKKQANLRENRKPRKNGKESEKLRNWRSREMGANTTRVEPKPSKPVFFKSAELATEEEGRCKKV